MADIYDRGKAQCARMLGLRSAGGYGAALTIRRTTTGEYDPETGTSGTTTTDYAGSGIRKNYQIQDVDGSLIKAGDLQFIVSPVLLSGSDMPEPTTTDKLVFDGDTYTIASVKSWDFAGLALGFVVQARK